jgi:hypothetical protein
MPVSDKEHLDSLRMADLRRLDDLRAADQRAVELLAQRDAANASRFRESIAILVALISAVVAIASIVVHH